MAHATLTTESGVFHRIAASVYAMLRSVGTALALNASAEARLREVERLQRLSDAELAELGIVRDRIVHHVFRDIYMI